MPRSIRYFFVDFGHTYEDISINYFERQAQAEKAANVAKHQDWRTHFNSVLICIFANVEPQTQVDLINAQLGLNWTKEDLMVRSAGVESQTRHRQPYRDSRARTTNSPRRFLNRITKVALQVLSWTSKPCWQPIMRPAAGIGKRKTSRGKN